MKEKKNKPNAFLIKCGKCEYSDCIVIFHPGNFIDVPFFYEFLKRRALKKIPAKCPDCGCSIKIETVF